MFKNSLAHVIVSPCDELDKQPPGNKTRTEVIRVIDLHISSGNPSLFHYQPKYALLRLYFPSELNAVVLHRYFNESNPEIKVRYEIHPQDLNQKNIKLANLGLKDYGAG